MLGGDAMSIPVLYRFVQVLKAQSAAKAEGYSDVLYLDSIHKKYLEEVSSCNVFVVKVAKKNRDPRWDEEFQFMLEEPPTDDRIHVEVVSTSKRMGLLYPKDPLGYVDISLADVVINKRINERYHLID